MNRNVTAQQEPNGRVHAIEPELLLQELQSGRCITLVDVRGRDEFRGHAGRIGGARSLPMHQLIPRQSELRCGRWEPIVVISGRGIRARAAAHALASAGFEEVTFLDGGMSRWTELGYPVARSPESLPPDALHGRS